MTGTADTEAYEFQSIYGLEVVVIPTAKPMIRDDKDDLVFLKAENKYQAIIDDIKDCVERASRYWWAPRRSKPPNCCPGMLKKQKVPHEVLNAKQHEREAAIVAQAGQAESGDHRHQHGRPRHRHRAGRQPGGGIAGTGRRGAARKSAGG